MERKEGKGMERKEGKGGGGRDYIINNDLILHFGHFPTF